MGDPLDDRISELRAELAAKDARIAEQAAKIAEQDARIAEQGEEIAALLEKLSQNSSNSHKPPSSGPAGHVEQQAVCANAGRSSAGSSSRPCPSTSPCRRRRR